MSNSGIIASRAGRLTTKKELNHVRQIVRLMDVGLVVAGSANGATARVAFTRDTAIRSASLKPMGRPDHEIRPRSAP